MVLNRSQFENMSKEELILELTYINSSFCQRHKCKTDYDTTAVMAGNGTF